MPVRTISIILVVLAVVGCGGREDPAREIEGLPPLLRRAFDLHIFYYAWYGTPETDGAWRHWNHAILDENSRPIGFRPGGDDIGSSFFPQGGCYSSNDPDVIARHMLQIRLAGTGVVCVSWWGADSYADRAVPLILEAARRHGLKVAFHIDAFEGRDAHATRGSIEYLIDTYGNHPAFYRTDRFGNRPMFYVNDSHRTPASDWAQVFTAHGSATIRGTRHDSVVIGRWNEEEDGDVILEAGFDGFYTYFAADGSTWGSTPDNWIEMAAWAWEHGSIFIPCIGPGHDDTAIRPWNEAARRDRKRGGYLEEMFRRAFLASPPFIGIMSFNEWRAGTQIEPAAPHTAGERTYLDYAPLPADFYLHKTRGVLRSLR